MPPCQAVAPGRAHIVYEYSWTASRMSVRGLASLYVHEPRIVIALTPVDEVENSPETAD